MAKFCDVVGYAESSETVPGVWIDIMVERKLFGEVESNSVRMNAAEMKVNSDISVGNSINVMADAYANNHFHTIRYVKWAGTLWIVNKVDVKSPRLILRLGGVYNGPTPPTPNPA